MNTFRRLISDGRHLSREHQIFVKKYLSIYLNSNLVTDFLQEKFFVYYFVAIVLHISYANSIFIYLPRIFLFIQVLTWFCPVITLSLYVLYSLYNLQIVFSWNMFRVNQLSFCTISSLNYGWNYGLLLQSLWK